MTLETGDGELPPGNRRFANPLADTGVVLSGAVLAGAGLQLPVLYAQTGHALALRRIGGAGE